MMDRLYLSMNFIKRTFICISFFLPFWAHSQDVVVFGVVTSIVTNKPIDYATVYIKNTSNATETDSLGQYRLKVNEGQAVTVVVSRIGYQEAEYKIGEMKAGSKRYVNIRMAESISDLEIVVSASKFLDGGMVREEVTEFKLLPNASGNFESVLPHIALGVSSGQGGELSAQYNVRGGNYDENLIYVNDFEIFKPQLIRAGQQEGLSFPNIDLMRDLSFSSGGYQAKYGDKMSSVLDIRYKRPEAFSGSASASLLGASLHLEGSKRVGANAYNKFRYLFGARYKTNRYLLSSLDVKGEYIPNFVDIQSYLTYDITKSLQIGVIGNYSDSRYDFQPATRSTALGLINFALKLTSVFEGQEKDAFINGMTGVSLTYVPEKRKNPLYLKLLGSTYSSSEQENFDILGYYRLAQIETNFGSDSFGEEVEILGVGTQQNFARNYLYNRIQNLEHKGGIEFPNIKSDGRTSHFIQWGLKAQKEIYEDEINEWERIDSADYSLPYNGKTVNLAAVLKTRNNLENVKINGFLQNTYSIIKSGRYEVNMNGGIRLSYVDLNNEILISPRVNIGYQPYNWTRDISFKLAGGIYYQTPFYRELRQRNGIVNTDVLSQKSTQIVAGVDYDFKWKNLSNKPFKIISEIYYKKLDNLISYDVDNVRIRYSGINDASGYAAGLDFRVNGEFVPGAESWVNIGLLKTRESFYDVEHTRKGSNDSIPRIVKYVPRPTDRLMTFNMFFQDYLPKNENFKVNLNFSFGTGLPFGIKDDNEVSRNPYRFRQYHRVDAGFIYQIWDPRKEAKNPDHWLRNTNTAALSLEVFNMLGIANPASNTWIKTITNTQYAIANNLTGRRLNLRLRVDF